MTYSRGAACVIQYYTVRGGLVCRGLQAAHAKILYQHACVLRAHTAWVLGIRHIHLWLAVARVHCMTRPAMQMLSVCADRFQTV